MLAVVYGVPTAAGAVVRLLENIRLGAPPDAKAGAPRAVLAPSSPSSPSSTELDFGLVDRWYSASYLSGTVLCFCVAAEVDTPVDAEWDCIGSSSGNTSTSNSNDPTAAAADMTASVTSTTSLASSFASVHLPGGSGSSSGGSVRSLSSFEDDDEDNNNNNNTTGGTTAAKVPSAGDKVLLQPVTLPAAVRALLRENPLLRMRVVDGDSWSSRPHFEQLAISDLDLGSRSDTRPDPSSAVSVGDFIAPPARCAASGNRGTATAAADNDHTAKLDGFLAAEVRRPFADAGCLFRVTPVLLCSGTTALVLSVHHVVADGLAATHILRRLLTHWAAASAAAPAGEFVQPPLRPAAGHVQPSLDRLVDVRPTLAHMLAEVLYDRLPALRPPTPGLYLGPPHRDGARSPGGRTLFVPAALCAELRKHARNMGATVSGVLGSATAFATAAFAAAAPGGTLPALLSMQHARNMRPDCGLDADALRAYVARCDVMQSVSPQLEFWCEALLYKTVPNYLTPPPPSPSVPTLTHVHQRQHKHREAARFQKETMEKNKLPGIRDWGLLNFLAGSWVAFFAERLTQRRPNGRNASVSISNLGCVDMPAVCNGLLFAQSKHAEGPCFQVCGQGQGSMFFSETGN